MAEEVRHLPQLPVRARDAHKGDFGHVLVIAGSQGMTGAACLTAMGAQRAGAGLVTVAVAASLQPIVAAKLTSAMSHALPEPEEPVVGEEAARWVLENATRFDAVALGPGLGRHEETGRAVCLLAAELPRPLVIDADGLNALAGKADVLGRAPAPRVVTPHPGEMARLAGLGGAEEVQRDRVGVSVAFAARHAAVVVLKGARTVVTDGRRAYVNPTGNPGMASGGTGDVLTGMIAGLLCQGLEPFEAAQMGAFVHGLAGDLAAREEGELSLTAEDLVAQVGRAFLAVAGAPVRADAEAVARAVLARTP